MIQVPPGVFRAVYRRGLNDFIHMSVVAFDDDWRPLVTPDRGRSVMLAQDWEKPMVTFIRVEAVPR